MKQFLKMNKVSRVLISSAVLLSIAVSSFAQSNSKVDSSRILKVLTFNIWHGENHYKADNVAYESSLEVLAKVINKAKPDLVALQEVDNRTGRSKGVDLATELGLLTKMNPLFGATMKFDGGEYGLGILSKFSYQSSKLHRLFSVEGTEPRAALEAIVVTNTGDTVRFISTHFDHRENTVRIKQSENINEFFTDDDIFSIVAGDFNARPGSEPIHILNKQWTISSKNNEPTSPSINPRGKIDYIMYKSAKKWRVIESKVIDERIASDHNPVLTVFELLDK